METSIFFDLPTLWLVDIAMENGPFIDDFPIKLSIYTGISMVMLNNQRVYSSIHMIYKSWYYGYIPPITMVDGTYNSSLLVYI